MKPCDSCSSEDGQANALTCGSGRVRLYGPKPPTGRCVGTTLTPMTSIGEGTASVIDLDGPRSWSIVKQAYAMRSAVWLALPSPGNKLRTGVELQD